MSNLLQEIEAQIAGAKTATAKQNVGIVREIGDGVAKIEGLTRILVSLAKILVCSGALAAVSFGLWHGLRTFADSGLLGLVAVVVAVFGIGGLVYLGAALLLRVEELSVVNLLLRRGRKRLVPPEETEVVP